ncbi:50S ribosomal protein L4, partial [Leucobacter sp. OLES1]
PSTKAAREFLANVAPGKRVLVVIGRDDELTVLSVRNLPGVHVIAWDQLNAYDVVVSDDLVFTKGAYDAFVDGRAAEEVSK